MCTSPSFIVICCRLRLKCDGTCAETRFRLSARRTSTFKSAGVVSSVDYWQESCTHQSAGFVLLVQDCVLQSNDAYWLPSPFSCFPFTALPVRHRVPSHFKRSLRKYKSIFHMDESFVIEFNHSVKTLTKKPTSGPCFYGSNKGVVTCPESPTTQPPTCYLVMYDSWKCLVSLGEVYVINR